jgi:Skp family chaperone for outer membrane proteins
MTNIIKVLAAVLVVSFSSSALAAKIGIIDMQKVILNVGEGKAERSKLERQAKSKGKKLEKLKNEVESLGKVLQNKEKIALMSESALKKKAQAFQMKLRELQQGERKMLVDIKKQEAKATDKIAQKVTILVEQMAAKQNLDAVFETSNAGLMYAKDYVDLTSSVISIYDKSKVKLAKNKK